MQESTVAADPATLTPVQQAYLAYLRGERIPMPAPPQQPTPQPTPLSAADHHHLHGFESPANFANFGNTPPSMQPVSLQSQLDASGSTAAVPGRGSQQQQTVTLRVSAADLADKRPPLSQSVSTGRADRRNRLKGSAPTASFASGREGYAESWFGDAGQTGALAHQHQLQHQARAGGSATAEEIAVLQRERSVAAALHHRESLAETSGQAMHLVSSTLPPQGGAASEGGGHGGRCGISSAAALAAATSGSGGGAHRPGSPVSYLDGLGSASAPAPTPLTRFDPEDEPMWNLVNAVRESYRIRAEAAAALESLGRDFSRDFSPAEHPHRRPARSLVIKASNIVSRLQAMGKGLEGAASIGLRVAQAGASERESIIHTLQTELHEMDVDCQRQLFAMRKRMESHALEVAHEMAAERELLVGCMREAEEDVDASGASYQRAMREKDQALALAGQARQAMMEAQDESGRMRKLAEEADRAREEAEEDGRRLADALAAEKESRRRDAQLAQQEADSLRAEAQGLRDQIADLEGTGSAAARRLRNAELEGGNLRSLASAAVDKLEVQTAEMAGLRGEIDEHRRSLLRKDEVIAQLEEQLRELREALGEVDSLKSIVAELQKVLQEAMKAGTWQQCRQILYHESLRYVSSAATHGKAPSAASASGGQRRQSSGAPRRQSTRLTDGAAIANLMANAPGGSDAGSSPRASSPGARSVSPSVTDGGTASAERRASHLLHAPVPAEPRDAPRRVKPGR